VPCADTTKKPPGGPHTARGRFNYGHNETVSQTEFNNNRFYNALQLLTMTISGKSFRWIRPACPQMIITNGQQQSSLYYLYRNI
jgi:hypothetical protein